MCTTICFVATPNAMVRSVQIHIQRTALHILHPFACLALRVAQIYAHTRLRAECIFACHTDAHIILVIYEIRRQLKMGY